MLGYSPSLCGNQGRNLNLNHREEQKEMTACMALACTLVHVSSCIQFWTTFLGNGVTNSGLGLATPVNLIKTIPRHGHPNVDN